MTDNEASVRAGVESLVSEALELRYKSAGDPKGPLGIPNFSEVSAMFDDLVRIRQRDDRVDEILSRITRIKWQVKRQRDDKAFDAEIAFDEIAMSEQAKRDVNSFSSSLDRKAAASIGSIAQKRALRKADRLVDIANEAFEVVNQIHWQLSAMRRELVAAMKAFQVDQNLDH